MQSDPETNIDYVEPTITKQELIEYVKTLKAILEGGE